MLLVDAVNDIISYRCFLILAICNIIKYFVMTSKGNHICIKVLMKFIHLLIHRHLNIHASCIYNLNFGTLGLPSQVHQDAAEY